MQSYGREKQEQVLEPYKFQKKRATNRESPLVEVSATSYKLQPADSLTNTERQPFTLLY
uniref:Uncharacterized protein n=1 Tax=Tetraselmis sp. GSL018 TaxID=582737 RepID=A0A061QNN9_9CHLO